MSSSRESDARSRGWLIAVVVAGLLLRLAWSWYAARVPAGLHDPGLYRALARSIAEGRGYAYPLVGPSAYYPPGYPGALAVFVWLFQHTPLPGDDTVAVVALNLLAGATVIVLTAGVARRIAGERAGLAAASIVALWPNMVVHAAVALSETLFLALVLAATLVAIDGDWKARRFSAPRLLAIGLLIASASYVRPIAVPLIGVLFVTWLLCGFGPRRTLSHAGLVVLSAATALVPWILRNDRVVGSYVFTTNTGDNLCMSRQPGADGGFQLTGYCAADRPAHSRGAYERLRDEEGRRRALAYIRDQPLSELALWPRRLWHSLENDFDGVRAVESYGDDIFLPPAVRRVLQLASDGWFVLVALVAALSVPIAWRDDRRVTAILLGSIIAMGFAPVVLFFGDPRFHVPAVPFLAVLAGVGLARVLAPRPVVS